MKNDKPETLKSEWLTSPTSTEGSKSNTTTTKKEQFNWSSNAMKSEKYISSDMRNNISLFNLLSKNLSINSKGRKFVIILQKVNNDFRLTS